MSKKKSKTVTNEVVETVPWHNMKVKAVYDKLGTHEKGLWEKDVVDRLSEFGPNKITITERFKILKMLAEQFTDFLVILLIVAGLISLAFGIYNTTPEHLGEEIYDAIAIFAIVILNAVIGFVQELCHLFVQ